MECFPVSSEVVRGLYHLACTPFVEDEFQAVWSSLGWTVEASRSEIDVVAYQVHVNADVCLDVLPKGSTVYAAVLSFCFYGEEARPGEYEAAYLRALRLTEEALGPPIRQGEDPDIVMPERVYHYAIWRGTTGLLVLQQSFFDVHRGRDMNLWLQRWSNDEEIPDSGIEEWLVRRCCERFAP